MKSDLARVRRPPSAAPTHPRRRQPEIDPQPLTCGAAKTTVFALANPDCVRRIQWKTWPNTKPTGSQDEATLARWDDKLLRAQLVEPLAKDHQLGKGSRAAIEAIRAVIPPSLEGDRWYATEMRQALELVRSGAVVEAAENAVGRLH